MQGSGFQEVGGVGFVPHHQSASLVIEGFSLATPSREQSTKLVMNSPAKLALAMSSTTPRDGGAHFFWMKCATVAS